MTYEDNIDDTSYHSDEHEDEDVDVEHEEDEISHAKEKLVGDEKNAGLRKSKKVALVSSKVNRGSTIFTSDSKEKMNT